MSPWRCCHSYVARALTSVFCSHIYRTDNGTRGHSWALAKERCKLDIRTYAFSQRTINEWNRLSGECVNATSVNMFKNKIDNYFKRSGYV